MSAHQRSKVHFLTDLFPDILLIPWPFRSPSAPLLLLINIFIVRVWWGKKKSYIYIFDIFSVQKNQNQNISYLFLMLHLLLLVLQQLYYFLIFEHLPMLLLHSYYCQVKQKKKEKKWKKSLNQTEHSRKKSSWKKEVQKQGLIQENNSYGSNKWVTDHLYISQQCQYAHIGYQRSN